MPAPDAESRASLADRLAATVAAAPLPLGVAVRGDDGWAWDHEADRVVPAASTAKVLVLVATLRLVEHGRLRLDEVLRLPPPADRVGGAGALSLLPSVSGIPLGEALALMVAVSDNDAGNAVLDHAALLAGPGGGGADPMGEMLAEVPTRHTRLRRRFMDAAAAAEGRDNVTTAADLADVVAALRQGRLLGPDHTGRALDILRTQQSRDGLPAYLGPDVTVASKPGDLRGVRAEVALLERGGRWVVASVTAEGLERSGSDRGTALLPVFASVGELAAGLL